MGRYNDIREEVEDDLLAETAKAKGMSVYEYVESCKHDDYMERGRRLYQQRKAEDDLIVYYLTFVNGYTKK